LRRVGSALVLALVLALGLVSGSAFGAGGKGSPEERQARALFDQGLALSDEGKWSEALEVFRKSDTLTASANVRYNIAAALRALGKYVEAKRTIDETIAAGDAKTLTIKPALKKELEKLRAEVAGKIVHIRFRKSPADADVEVDGSAVSEGADGRVGLDPGKHVFVIRKQGYDPTTVNQTLSAGDTEVVLTAPKTKVVEVPRNDPFYKKGWFWGTVGGVVAAGAAVTVIVVVTGADKNAGAAPPDSTVGRVIPAALRF